MAGAKETPEAKRQCRSHPDQVTPTLVRMAPVQAGTPSAAATTPRKPDLPTCPDAVCGVPVLPLTRALIVYVKYELRLRIRGD